LLQAVKFVLMQAMMVYLGSWWRRLEEEEDEEVKEV
jgi:hypothetical protein